jgi:hypothetical protein
MLRYYEGSYAKALIHLFPEIDLDENKLQSKYPSASSSSISLPYFSFCHLGKYWLDVKNQQDLLIEFAQEKGFSAFDPEPWYSVNPDAIYSAKVNNIHFFPTTFAYRIVR